MATALPRLTGLLPTAPVLAQASGKPNANSAVSQRPTMKLGDSGPLVVELQITLQKQGFFKATVDGQFQNSTKLAVENFQRATNLKVNGIVDGAVWERLLLTRGASLPNSAPVPSPTIQLPSPKPIPSPTIKLANPTPLPSPTIALSTTATPAPSPTIKLAQPTPIPAPTIQLPSPTPIPSPTIQLAASTSTASPSPSAQQTQKPKRKPKPTPKRPLLILGGLGLVGILVGAAGIFWVVKSRKSGKPQVKASGGAIAQSPASAPPTANAATLTDPVTEAASEPATANGLNHSASKPKFAAGFPRVDSNGLSSAASGDATPASASGSSGAGGNYGSTTSTPGSTTGVPNGSTPNGSTPNGSTMANTISHNGTTNGTTNGMTNGVVNPAPQVGTSVTLSSGTITPPPPPPPPPQSNALAVNQTNRLARVDIVDELVHDLRHAEPTKRQKSIWELGQRGDSRAIQPLVDLLIDSDSRQRSLILAALSEIGIRTMKPMNRALAVSLQDENAEVRKNAIRDLTRIYDLVAQISQLLRHATEDQDQSVQETARWALGQLNRIRSAAEIDNLPALKKSVSPPENL